VLLFYISPNITRIKTFKEDERYGQKARIQIRKTTSFRWKTGETKPHGRPRRRWEYNIKMDLKN
jgi:hypothetical protein